MRLNVYTFLDYFKKNIETEDVDYIYDLLSDTYEFVSWYYTSSEIKIDPYDFALLWDYVTFYATKLISLLLKNNSFINVYYVIFPSFKDLFIVQHPEEKIPKYLMHEAVEKERLESFLNIVEKFIKRDDQDEK